MKNGRVVRNIQAVAEQGYVPDIWPLGDFTDKRKDLIAIFNLNSRIRKRERERWRGFLRELHPEAFHVYMFDCTTERKVLSQVNARMFQYTWSPQWLYALAPEKDEHRWRLEFALENWKCIFPAEGVAWLGKD